jgi:uncharacterized protein (DUF1697 family)
MADLREAAQALGLENAATLLQSGNLLFESPKCSTGAMEAALEQGFAKVLGLKTVVIVRTAAEMTLMERENPFEKEAAADPARLAAVFLKAAPAKGLGAELQSAIAGNERVALRGSTLYAHYPEGMGRSKLTLVTIERKLRVAATARNWNTVLKIRGAL